MKCTDKYKNLLTRYREEMIKNAHLGKLYNDACAENTVTIRGLNTEIYQLYQQLLVIKGVDKADF